jgi:hypothetical protein
MPDIPLNLDENIVWVGAAGFSAHADKVIILQDDFRSGFECKVCLDEDKRNINGREVTVVRCEECKGEGKRPKAGNEKLSVRCTECEGRGVVVCPECDGKGGTIILAENTKGRPMSGTIVSIGPDAGERWSRGEKCLYPSYAGHAYDLKGQTKDGRIVDVVLLILRETEILVRMHGSLEQNQVKRSMALHTNA